MILSAEAEERRFEHDARAWVAWTTAACFRAKTMPGLKDLQHRERPKDVADRLKATLKATLPVRKRNG